MRERRRAPRGTAFALVSALLAAAPACAGAAAPDPLTRMFAWWNGAIGTRGSFTAEAFGRYFDPQASLVVNGRLVAHGLPDLAQHFQRIQANGAAVEIALPFKDAFRSGDKLYTYHVINSRLNGKVGCELAAGRAVLKAGRILDLMLVEKDVDYSKPPVDPQCWQR